MRGLGSPPRVREKRIQTIIFRSCSGITPACAGKTDSLCKSARQIRDHPRMCGKNSTLRNATWPISGSPPHVREKPPLHPWCRSTTRITPACAGKTTTDTNCIGMPLDHPRMCGKNHLYIRGVGLRLGSPPPVREKRPQILIQLVSHGITPACAGKTSQKGLFGAKPRDHPRMCGKNIVFPQMAKF